MKTRRNAVLLVVASVFGTVAYMTSKDEVKNTFTLGKMAIDLDEAQVTEAGKPVEGAARVKENSYKLVPGLTYTKDPMVTVLDGSEASYVRVETEETLGDAKYFAYDKEADTLTYYFYYNETVAAPNGNVELPVLVRQHHRSRMGHRRPAEGAGELPD